MAATKSDQITEIDFLRVTQKVTGIPCVTISNMSHESLHRGSALGSSCRTNFYAEQLFSIPERNFFLGFTGQFHCPKPVGLLLHVGKRVIGCKHHPIYIDVVQQKMKQVTAGEMRWL